MDSAGNLTLRDVWDDKVDRFGDEEFLVFESTDGTIQRQTYAECYEGVCATAHALYEDLGIRKGDKVAIHLSNCPEYLHYWFGISLLGAITVFSDPKHTVDEAEYTYSTADVTAVITAPEHRTVVENAANRTDVDTVLYRSTDDNNGPGDTDFGDLVDAAPPELPDTSLESLDPAQIVFTSGTTGKPKGVVLTHANILNHGSITMYHAAFRSTDRVCTALPAAHMNAQDTVILPTLRAGGTLVLVEEFKSAAFIEQLRRHDVTVTSIISTQARAMLQTEEREIDDDHEIREVIYAIPMSQKEKKKFTSRFDLSLLSMYGLTETAMLAYAPLHDRRNYPSVGLPSFGRTIEIVDDEGNQVDQGETGEIRARGTPGRDIMLEYYEMPEKTREVYRDGWFYTGDYAWFDQDGYIYFADREEGIIKTRGENVSETEIENALNDHPGVDDAAVVKMAHEIYGEAPRALVIRSDASLDETSLLAFAREHLAEYKVPQEVRFLDSFPRTNIGKIKKSALREDYEEGSANES